MTERLRILEVEQEILFAKEGLDGWANALTASIQNAKENTVPLLNESNNKALELLSEEKILKEEAKKLEKLLESQRSDIESIALSLKDLKMAHAEFPPKISHHSSIVEKLQLSMDSERKELEDSEKIKEMKNESLLFEVEKYRNAMGVCFDHASKDKSKLSFTNIDPLDPNREFFIILQIANDKYKVLDCHPWLNGIKKLEKEVNISNDFGLFVRNLRRGFLSTL